MVLKEITDKMLGKMSDDIQGFKDGLDPQNIAFWYKKIISKSTTTPSQILNYAQALQQMGDIDNAAKYLMRSIGVSYRSPLDYSIEDPSRFISFIKGWPWALSVLRKEGRSDVEIADSKVNDDIIEALSDDELTVGKFEKKYEDTFNKDASAIPLADLIREVAKTVIEDRLEENYNGPEGIELFWKPEILLNLLKKLEKLEG